MIPEQEAMEATEESTESQEEVVDDSNSSSDEGQATEETPRAAKADASEGQASEQKFDYEKSYKHLQSKYTKDSQRLKQFERDYNEKWKTQLEAYERLETALASNPRAVEALKQAFQQPIDPELAEDKVYKTLKPHIDEIQSMKSFIQEIQQERVQENAKKTLDTAESSAKSLYKNFLGKDMGEEQLNAVMQWMYDNRVYNGEAAVKAVFFDDIINHKSQSALQANQAKKSLGTTRTQTMNGNAAQKPEYYRTAGEAIRAAADELGWNHN
jgi:hypothetical protein